MDISTQVRQIAGRIRNTQYADTITHLYKATRYNTDLTYEEYKQIVLEEEQKAKSYITKVNSDKEIKEGTKEVSIITFGRMKILVNLYLTLIG